MLSVETVGSIWIPAVEKTGVDRWLAWNTAKSAHGPWRLEWESGAEICPAEAVILYRWGYRNLVIVNISPKSCNPFLIQ